jgi:hypothetical protein
VAEIKLGENLWNQFVIVAKKNRTRPERLAARVLRDYLARSADEELLAETEEAAQRKGATISKAEAAIKELRRKSRP